MSSTRVGGWRWSSVCSCSPTCKSGKLRSRNGSGPGLCWAGAGPRCMTGCCNTKVLGLHQILYNVDLTPYVFSLEHHRVGRPHRRDRVADRMARSVGDPRYRPRHAQAGGWWSRSGLLAVDAPDPRRGRLSPGSRAAAKPRRPVALDPITAAAGGLVCLAAARVPRSQSR